MSDLPQCVYCGVRRTRASLTVTGDYEMHGNCRRQWQAEQEAASRPKSPRVRKFTCDVCGESGTQTTTGPRRKRHANCMHEYHRQYQAARRPKPVPFVPSSFDEAMARGRVFYHAGLYGDSYPFTDQYLVSEADMASYSLGARHAKEFGRKAC